VFTIIILKISDDEEMKIGRNDPCPCGSGKKYKLCCLIKKRNKTYIFKVKLKYDKSTWWKIEILPNQTLHDLHEEIIHAVDFDFDHMYIFCMDNKQWASEVEYCDPRCDFGISAHEITIGELNLKSKQKFLYIYDFGANWVFEIDYVGNGEKDGAGDYPRIIASKGEAPEQYPTSE